MHQKQTYIFPIWAIAVLAPTIATSVVPVAMA